jgi:hypothetical protein
VVHEVGRLLVLNDEERWLRSFDRWDKNHDEQLSIRELEKVNSLFNPFCCSSFSFLFLPFFWRLISFFFFIGDTHFMFTYIFKQACISILIYIYTNVRQQTYSFFLFFDTFFVPIYTYNTCIFIFSVSQIHHYIYLSIPIYERHLLLPLVLSALGTKWSAS